MKVIRFSNKDTNTKKTVWGILILILSVFVFSYFNIDFKINHSVIYFILTLSYFLSTYVFSNKLTKGVKVLEFSDNQMKVIFFNGFKDSITLGTTDYDVVVKDNTINIIKRKSRKLVGVLYKEFLITSSEWEELLGLLQKGS